MEKRTDKLKLIFDTCSLITISKFKVNDKLILDYLLEIVDIHLPEEVYLEAVKGYNKYQDAREIKSRVDDKKILVREVMYEKNLFKKLEHYNIGMGEKYNRSVDEVVNELLKIGFEKKFRELYKRYQRGEISLDWMAKELGLSLRDTYDYLERRNLPLSAGFGRIHRRSEVVEK